MENNIRLMLATPSIDHKFHEKWVHSVFKLQRDAHKHNIKLNVQTLVGHSLIPVARTIMVRNFLETDATHLLFVDSDIGFEVEDVVSMIDCRKPVVGGVCVQKQYDWEAIARAADSVELKAVANKSTVAAMLPRAGTTFTFTTGDAGNDVDTDKREPVPIRYVGMGFTLIDRHIIERLVHAYRADAVKLPGGKPFPPLFAQSIVRGGDWLSEDYAFCHRANTLFGESTWLAWWTRTSHTGQHVFEGDLLTAGSLLGGVTQVQE